MIWIGAAILLGLSGALHCTVMCGPLVGFYANNSSKRIPYKMLKYHVGRVSSYTVLGAIVGVFSESLKYAGFQQWVSIALGVALLLGLILSVLVTKRISTKPQSYINVGYNKVRLFLINMAKIEAKNSPFYFGIANGLIPCGLVYTAMTSSLLAPSFTSIVAFMVIFGIANSPGLVFSGFISQKLNFSPKFKPFVKTSTIILVAFLLLYRGIYVKSENDHKFSNSSIITTCE